MSAAGNLAHVPGASFARGVGEAAARRYGTAMMRSNVTHCSCPAGMLE